MASPQFLKTAANTGSPRSELAPSDRRVAFPACELHRRRLLSLAPHWPPSAAVDRCPRRANRSKRCTACANRKSQDLGTHQLAPGVLFVLPDSGLDFVRRELRFMIPALLRYAVPATPMRQFASRCCQCLADACGRWARAPDTCLRHAALAVGLAYDRLRHLVREADELHRPQLGHIGFGRTRQLIYLQCNHDRSDLLAAVIFRGAQFPRKELELDRGKIVRVLAP
jgi:hypothetical protein